MSCIKGVINIVLYIDIIYIHTHYEYIIKDCFTFLKLINQFITFLKNEIYKYL